MEGAGEAGDALDPHVGSGSAAIAEGMGQEICEGPPPLDEDELDEKERPVEEEEELVVVEEEGEMGRERKAGIIAT